MSQKKLKKIRRRGEVEVSLLPADRDMGVVSVGFWEIIKEHWKFLVAVGVGIVVLFLNAMGGDFVSDDYATIPQNPMVANLAYTLKVTPNLVQLTNTLIAMVLGIGSSIPYHMLNLTIFLGVNLMVFVLAYLLFGKTVAQFSTLVFAVHPIHVEAVSWISGRPYSLFSLFGLIVLVSIILSLETRKRGYLVVMAVAGFLAFKADAARSLTWVFLVPLFLIYLGTTKKLKVNWSKLAVAGGIVAVLAVVLLWPAILTRIQVVNSGVNTSDSLFYDPLFQYPTSIAKYLQLLLVPIDLTLYHTMYVFPMWLNWFIFLNYVLVVVYFWFRDRRISFALLFTFVAIAASMAPVKVAWLVAERYMFFGSVGFCMFLGMVISSLERWGKAVSTGVLVLVMVWFGVRVYWRNIDWQTNHNLWVSTCQVSPNSHNAWNNIGDDYDKLKDYTNAIKGFTQSTIVKPNYADAYHNRANILFKVGRLDLARESYSTAIYFSPNLMQSYLSLTQIDLMEQRLDLALAHAVKAVELDPGGSQSLYVLAVVRAQRGEKNEAREILKTVLRVNPNFRPATEMLIALGAGDSS